MQNIKSASLITLFHRAIKIPLDRVHLRGGVDGSVAGGTLRDAGTVVDDVLMAVGALVTFLLPLASVVKILTEGKGDAAPALVGKVVLGTALNTVAFVLEPTAGHTVTGRVRLQAATKALVMAALVVLGACAIFALNRTHCRRKRNNKGYLMKQRCLRKTHLVKFTHSKGPTLCSRDTDTTAWCHYNIYTSDMGDFCHSISLNL